MPAVSFERGWLDRYCELARPLEGDRKLEPRKPGMSFRGPLWRLVDTEVRQALREGLNVIPACDRWYSGAYLLETIPSALYILAHHATDPEEAMVRAVNDTRDNDTVAAIVGAAVGALHGKALPASWISGLSGRLAGKDDGRVFELIDATRKKWFPGTTREEEIA